MSNPGAPHPAPPQPVAHQSNGNAAPETAIVAALGARSVVLVGMMGAGKSSIGRRLASRLGIPFVDADAEIEKAAGMSIPDIFATHGEPDFRAGEARVIARLLDGGPQVLATGGGAFMNADTRTAIGAKGVSIWLNADLETLMRRIKRRHDRPLLHTDDPAATLQQLIDARYPIYALADFTVQSREVPHEKIVDEIVAVLGAGPASAGCGGRGFDEGRDHVMTAPLRSSDPIVVDVALGDRSYDIVIGRGQLGSLGARIAKLRPGAKVAIVSDENVAARHLDAAVAAVKGAAGQVSTVVLPPGESTKSFAHLASLCDDLISHRIERSDLVVALGGGVIGDLTGFAAAIVRRGIDYIQVPTSLLSQVDSSVGGKTAIDSPQGKNLIGAFYQPVLVIADTALLDTLPEREFRAGYAEVAKYGLLGDAAFFAWLEANWKDVFAGGPAREHAIATSCRAKAAIVARDERETGDRMLLNLGHTFGHALEADAGFSDRLLHGEAIAIGMALAFEFSARRGLLPKAEAERAISHLAAVGLPTKVSQVPGGTSGIDRLMTLIGQDKKVTRGKLTFILARAIGNAFVAPDVDATEVRAFLAEKLA
jgi:shikimate kinase/3-dehydroquinate synthase